LAAASTKGLPLRQIRSPAQSAGWLDAIYASATSQSAAGPLAPDWLRSIKTRRARSTVDWLRSPDWDFLTAIAFGFSFRFPLFFPRNNRVGGPVFLLNHIRERPGKTLAGAAPDVGYSESLVVVASLWCPFCAYRLRFFIIFSLRWNNSGGPFDHPACLTVITTVSQSSRSLLPGNLRFSSAKGGVAGEA